MFKDLKGECCYNIVHGFSFSILSYDTFSKLAKHLGEKGARARFLGICTDKVQNVMPSIQNDLPP